MPNKDFAGSSTLGPRGDAIAEVDWAVGALVAELRKRGLEKNTLIIFTSDNGPVLDDGYDDHAVALSGKHDPAGGLRGGKYSAYEAGTRVPTIVYWPARVTPRESDALLTQVDLLASIATLTGAHPTPGLDSEDHLSAWLGESRHGRDVMIEEAFTLALRKVQWKYIQPHTGTVPGWMANKGVESGLQHDDQLYDLWHDPREQHNLADSLPEVVKTMRETLDRIVGSVQ
jgi:arylsulfatase A-like enzyme